MVITLEVSMPIKRKFLRGFTLIEIVISLAILAVGLLALLALFPVGFDAAKRSANITQAAIFAQQKMEEIKKDGFPETGTTKGNFTDDPRFSWTLNVIDVEPIGYLRKVTLTITWTHRNKERSEEFITYIAKFTP